MSQRSLQPRQFDEETPDAAAATDESSSADDALATGVEAGVATVATVAVLVGLRMGYGLATGDGVDWTTWVALVGGALGGVGMVLLVEPVVSYDEGDRPIVRQLQYVHLVYVTVAGAWYPWLASLAGLGNAWTRRFPEAFAGALALAAACYAVGMAAYLATGAVRAEREEATAWAVLAGFYAVFGVVLGAMLSLTSLWFSLP